MGEQIRVVRLGGDSEEAYEGFVRRHPHALLYHSLAFRNFLVDLLGCESDYAVALAGDGRVEGVLPLMASAGPYGRVLNSLPYFGSNGGILCHGDGGARSALAAWYEQRAGAPDVVAATVIANPFDTEADPPVHDLRDERIGCMTSLEGDGDPEPRLLAAIDGSARRNVAKAARSGVEVAVDNDAYAALESLHRAGMDAIGGRAKSPDFFAAVPRNFEAGTDFNLYIARMAGEVVAALLVFFYASTAEYYMPATDPEHRAEQPMAAILLRAMVDAADRGLRWWNWGGTWTSQENLIRFKTKWGGRAREYHYWTRLNDPEVLSATPDTLLAAYPGFFVVPFSSLRAGHGAGV